MSRIESTFAGLKNAGKKALIPFLTAGDPRLDATLPLMHALVDAGADLIELGVPFSDPMADGPTIQRASERALAQGVRLADVFDLAEQFRLRNQHTPIILMGYANPIEAMGYEEFARRAKTAGIDGVLTVDYPPEEAEEFAGQLTEYAIDPIFLLSPTTPDARIKQVAKLARGFVYYVSLRGVTGSAAIDRSDVIKKIESLRAMIAIPIGVGFGIRDAATAKTLSRAADAIVIGSRIVEEIESSSEDARIANCKKLVSGIREAMDESGLEVTT